MYFIRFWIRLITITMHFVQIRLCNFVNQKWWKRMFQNFFLDYKFTYPSGSGTC